MSKRLGVVFVGLNGAVSTTLITGVARMVQGLSPRIGMLTEDTDSPGERLTDLLRFTPLDSLAFAGWDARRCSVYEAAMEHGVLPQHEVEEVRPQLNILPWPAIVARTSPAPPKALHALTGLSFREELDKLEENITDFKNETSSETVVMVHLGSTAPSQAPQDCHASLDAFERALDRDDEAITPAMRYCYLANSLEIPHVNFTPNLTNVPALTEHAVLMRNPFAGMDGKTGQTLVKSALASTLRLRHLRVAGWYSANILGNNDGLTLRDPRSNEAKVRSKMSLLDSIVGYPVDDHQVHIHYYKPRGDAKESWDNIDLVGFCGGAMQLKINFLCRDSILAAPLVIDLIRLMAVAKEAGESGIQHQCSLYFKSPHAAPSERVEHELFKQERLLFNWARKVQTRQALWQRTSVGVSQMSA
jgi:myo-inositol-1-phosphate synthase